MTREKTRKRRVRERMAKTGESYTTARTQVTRKAERVRDARTRLSESGDRPADERLREATGRGWDSWFSILDRWGGRDRTHRATARHLIDERGVPGWWAQTITVWYQRSRGIRLKHQQADGFTIYASKTVAVPVGDLYEAFVNPRRRKRWLGDVTMRVRTKQEGKTARFDWEDGTTRLVAAFEGKGRSKSTVSVAHERLPDADEAETAKAAWRKRLTDLKSYLEA